MSSRMATIIMVILISRAMVGSWTTCQARPREFPITTSSREICLTSWSPESRKRLVCVQRKDLLSIWSWWAIATKCTEAPMEQPTLKTTLPSPRSPQTTLTECANHHTMAETVALTIRAPFRQLKLPKIFWLPPRWTGKTVSNWTITRNPSSSTW